MGLKYKIINEKDLSDFTSTKQWQHAEETSWTEISTTWDQLTGE